jgi:putative heme iron utilization protein
VENLGFPPESERSMVDHMNEWYADANLRYAQAYGQLWQATAARMVALDKAGMELEVTLPDRVQRLRIPFEQRLNDEGEAQQTLVEMSFKARELLAQHAKQNG